MHYFYKLFIALVMVLPLQLNAQKRFSALSLKPANHPVLSRIFKQYELVTLDTKNFNQYIRSTANREIRVDLNLAGKTFPLVIHERDILSSDYQLIVATARGRQVYKKPQISTYAGKLAGDSSSSVYLTITDNMIHGMINGRSRQYFIEPARHVDRKIKNNALVLYEPKNVIPHSGASCGITEAERRLEHLQSNTSGTANALTMPEAVMTAEQSSAGQPVTNVMSTLDAPVIQQGTASGTCKMIRVALASDDSMYYKYGSADAVQERNIGILNIMNGLYSNAQFGTGYLQFRLVGQYIATTPDVNPLTPAYSGPGMLTLLANFTRWGQNGNFGLSYDLGELWTGRDIAYQDSLKQTAFDVFSVIGLANLGSIGQSNAYNILEDAGLGLSAASSGTLEAHETGHTLNAIHDASGAPYIMSPATSNPPATTFSSASIAAITNYLAQYGTGLSSCSLSPVVAQFNLSSTGICLGSTVTCTDYSVGPLTGRSWSFPGGSPATSTSAAPKVTYSTTGIKTITLTDSSAAGIITISKTVFVGNTLKTACSTSVAGNTETPVIFSFSLGQINYSVGSYLIYPFYYDNSCTANTGLKTSSTYLASANLGFSGNGMSIFNKVQVFIDYNNDGDFTDSGEAVYASANSGQGPVYFNITTPASVPVTNQLLRMRVVAMPNALAKTDGCKIPKNAQVLDFAVYFTANPNIPTITAGGPTTFCNGGSVVLTSSPGNSYKWSTGETTAAITATATGNYTVIVTGAEGSSDTSAITTVTVNPAPLAAINAGGPTTFCAGGNVMLTASGGATYKWSSGETTTGITAVKTGQYSVIATGSNGCADTSAPITVTVNPLPTPSITSGSATTFCAGQNVQLTSSAATSYLWSTSETSGSITATNTGNYSVTVTDANGCSGNSLPTTITVNPLPVATITPGGPTTFCAGGSVILTASPGSSYLWSTNETTPAITVTKAGNYTVTVTNTNGCSATSTATTIIINPLPLAQVSADGPATFCAGGSVALTASGGISYHWSSGDNTASIRISGGGNYQVTATDGNGCSATSAPTAVVVNPLPVVTITPDGPTTFCAGGKVALTASPANNYLWSTNETTKSITATNPGNYSVTVTDLNGCSATSLPTAVSVNPLPVASITPASATTFCAGGSVTLTASPGSSYLWSTQETTASITVIASGSYTVRVTNGNGCMTISAPVNVTVNPLPAVTINPAGPTTFCVGGSVQLLSTPATSYLWSNQETTPAITVATPGNYSVTVTDNNGCSATSAAVAVTVNALPVPAITAAGPTTFCAGGNVKLTASAGSAYLWSTNETTPAINVSGAGSYTVTVTDGNGCSATTSVTNVVVNALPVANIAAPLSVTTGTTGNSASVFNAGANATYAWSIRNGTITAGSSTNVISFTAGVFGADTLSVIVTNNAGCVAASGNILVPISSATCPAVNVAAQAVVCSGSMGNMASVASGGKGAVYTWAINNGTITAGSTTNTITYTAGATGNVTLSVTVINSSNCKATSPGKIIKINPLPVAAISAATTVCGNSLLNTASVPSAGPGAYYSWSISNGTIIFGKSCNAIIYAAGGSGAVTLSVTVAISNGCSVVAANKTVAINAVPNAAITAAPSVCTGSTGNAASVNSAGSGANYAWTIINGSITGGNNTNSITYKAGALGITTLSVIVVNSNGCSYLSPLKQVGITTPQVPVFTQVATICQGNAAPALPTRSINGITGNWNPATISTAGTGIKAYTFTPSAGQCALSTVMKITVQPCTTKLVVPGIANTKTDEVNDSLKMDAVLLPNPTQNSFALTIKSSRTEEAEIRVYDMSGRSLDHLRANSGGTVYFGGRYVQGIYIVEVLQGTEHKILKAVKQ